MTSRPDVPTPEFGVVVLNWNNPSDTLVCLDSLYTTDPRPAHVVVVDNASGDDSVARIKEWGERNLVLPPVGRPSWLTIIQSATNRGFAGGSNVGIDYLLSDTAVTHVMLFNNDATLEESFFADMSDAIARRPDAGILGPTIYEHEDRTRVWYAGGVEYSWRALMQHKLERPQDDTPVDTPFVTGCAMVIARRTFERIGTLAECYYPAYWEDGDISMRARAAKLPVIYVPFATAYHKVGASVQSPELAVMLTHCRNRLRVFFVRRNYHGFTKGAALAYLAVTKPARALVEALKGHPRIGWAVFAGTLSGFVSRDAHR